MNEQSSVPANEINGQTDVCLKSGQQSKNKTWRVYGLSDPRKPGKVRYIGATSDLSNRFKKHLSRPNSESMGQWIKSIREANLLPSVRVFAEFDNEAAALEKERELIANGKNLLNVAGCPGKGLPLEPAVDLENIPTLEEMEKEHIRSVLRATGWNKLESARILGIGRQTLYNKLAQHGIGQ